MIRWLFVFPLIAASAHIFEEFVYPGGFRPWYIRYRPMVETFLTNQRLVWINVVLLVAAATAAITGPRHGGKNTWMIVVSIVAWNSVFHITGAVRSHRYSPGMITAITLYLPMAFVGFYELVHHRLVSLIACGICFSVGALYHLFLETQTGLRWLHKDSVENSRVDYKAGAN